MSTVVAAYKKLNRFLKLIIGSTEVREHQGLNNTPPDFIYMGQNRRKQNHV